MLPMSELETMFGDQTLARMIGLTERDARTLAERGRDLIGVGAYEEARGVFEALVTLNPHDPAMWAVLGDLCEKQHRFQEAAEAYRASLAIDSELALARVNLDGLLRRKLIV